MIKDLEPYTEPVVILNSGGFDSIVLAHYAKYILQYTNVHLIHFLYGARNEKPQLECVKKCAEKLDQKLKVIQLPKIDWSRGDFFSENKAYDAIEYVEYRNLIFLSYAISYAQSVGAKRILLAYLSATDYADTSYNFIDGLNLAISESDIIIETPFMNNCKDRLGHIARYLNIKDDEYFSCDSPIEVGGKLVPCEVCKKCESIRYIKEICKKVADEIRK